MKLLIPLDICTNYTLSNSQHQKDNLIQEMIQDFEDYQGKILKSFNIAYSINASLYGFVLYIHAQKITLDDIDMNTLFSEVFEYMDFHYSLTYVCLGETGCEMCLEINQE